MNNYTNNDEEYIAENIIGKRDPNELYESAKEYGVCIKKCCAVLDFLKDHQKYRDDFVTIYKFKKSGGKL